MLVKSYKKYIIAFIIIIFIALIGPLDVFSHGFFSNVPNYSDIDKTQIVSNIDLEDRNYESEFVVLKKHFTGFQIILNKPVINNNGKIILSVVDVNGNLLEKKSITLDDINNLEWYSIGINTTLISGQRYILKIEAENCRSYPKLLRVTNQLLMPESITGDALIGFAYRKSTFSIKDKFIIITILVLYLIFLLNNQKNKKITKYMKNLGIFFVLTLLLSYNFMTNFLLDSNFDFDGFQSVSETLVSGMLRAEKDNLELSRYGLGRYLSTIGEYRNYSDTWLTNEDWDNGYSKTSNKIVIANNIYTTQVAQKGYFVIFENGIVKEIENVEIDNEYIVITFYDQEIMKCEEFGNISAINFCDSDRKLFDKGAIKPYVSQYGLQGKVFKLISHIYNYNNIIKILNVMCCLATAVIFVTLVYLIKYKYNILMAFCFYITFLLSPWIVNYARNLYWVEFTWFIPMTIGLICSITYNKKIYRLICYVLCFLSIFMKCLCGYEYISTIMFSMISFLIVDFINSITERKRESTILLFKTIVCLGVMAILGFVFAICIHANLRGDGSIVNGIELIMKEDVLRRTYGGSFNNFDEVYWASFDASAWETLCRYFSFETTVIGNLSGKLFPFLSILPLVIFIYGYNQNRNFKTAIYLYICFFIASTSWYVLAKSHSYIHTHMNYVLWYFGFVQIVVYMILCFALGYIRKILRKLIKEEMKK